MSRTGRRSVFVCIRSIDSEESSGEAVRPYLRIILEVALLLVDSKSDLLWTVAKVFLPLRTLIYTDD